jgi:hypothetical protein
MELQDLRHRGRILARGPGPFGELVEDALDLLLWRADRDQAVGELTGPLGRDWAGRGDVDRRRFLRHGPEPARLHLEEAAFVFDFLAAEELGDDLDRFEHAIDAFRDLGPVAGEDVLVERLTRAEPQPCPCGVHDLQGCRRLGDDGRVHPKRRARHTRAHVPGGAGTHDGKHLPHEGCLALPRCPRLKMIGRHHPGEPGRLGPCGVVEHFRRPELLQHCRVSDLRFGHRFYPKLAVGRRAKTLLGRRRNVTLG